eukprot:COSAG06_NODE_55252_length_290_cov_1.078534_1_plen_30_part_10
MSNDYLPRQAQDKGRWVGKTQACTGRDGEG